jgi:hypothetical protein
LDELSSGGEAPESPGQAPNPEDEPTAAPSGAVSPDRPPDGNEIPVLSHGLPALISNLKLSLSLPSRNRKRWLGVAAGVAIVVALLLAGWMFIGRGAIASSSPGLPPGADATGVASAAVRSTESAPTAGPSGSAAASSNQPSTASAVPTQTAPTATITFRNLVVDSAVDPNRTARTFTFTSDGPGAVSAQVVASSPMDGTTLCLSVADAQATCATGGTPGFPSVVTTMDQTRWIVTLISAGESSPTLDLALSWPTTNPSVTLTHGRFQGTPNRDSLRTLTANFLARAGGIATLDASWPPVTSSATATLAEVSNTGQTTVGEMRYMQAISTSPIYSAPVGSGKLYRLDLVNDGADGLRADLKATITFP